MRRALIGTVAAWFAGAASVLAQAPSPAMPAPPGYSPYTTRSAHFDAPTADEGRRAMVPNYGPAGPYYGPVAPAYGPAAPNYGPAGAPAYMPGYPAGVPAMMGPGGMMPVRGEGPPMAGAPAGPVIGPATGPAMQIMPDGTPMMMAPNGTMVPGGRMMNPGYGNPPWGGWNNGGEGCWDGSCANGCGNGCGNNCSRCPCGPCGPEGKAWGSAELLLWWTKGQTLPPLVTMGTSAANPGILGQPGTRILFGGDRIGEDLRLGGRLRLGFWLDECQTIGVEGSFTFLGVKNDNFVSDCIPGDFLGRPFFNVDPAVNAPDAEIVCAPGILSGNVSVRTQSEFYAADANLRRNLICQPTSRIDLIGGFRYMHLGDDLAIREVLTNLSPARGVVGEGFIVQDRFHANNNFYGGQIGMAGELRSGQVFVDWRALIGLGATTRTVTINGSTTFIDPITPLPTVVQPGGLLAQPSNIGVYSSSDFSVAPELGLNLGYQVTSNVRVWVGYSFLYWNNIARAGEQIDLNVDARQLPTRAGPGVGTRPAFVLNTNDFWAQGVSFGLQLRF